jgi:hypothetical protein
MGTLDLAVMVVWLLTVAAYVAVAAAMVLIALFLLRRLT